MKPYYQKDGITVYHGDCREVVPSIGQTIATVITDPPYGLEFMGKGWDHGVPDAETWLALHSSLVPGSLILAFGGTRTWHRLACAIEDAGYEIRDTLMWLYGQGFPKSLDISKAIDKAAGAEREVVGESARHGGGTLTGAGWNIPAEAPGLTAPATPAAKLWQGYGTALKPAWEPVILAMKPTNGTFAENALKHGVAGLNIDGGRIGTTDKLSCSTAAPYADKRTWNTSNTPGIKREQSTLGRFPANLLLDEYAAAMLDEQSGESKSTANPRHNQDFKSVSKGAETAHTTHGHTDTGGASRFFYVAKASNADRGNVKAGPLPLFGEGEHEDRNEHPTVKPTSLMEYLCRLTRPPDGGTVLDPFMGSGSTLIAAKSTGRKAVGVEIEERYCEIAAKRLSQGVLLP